MALDHIWLEDVLKEIHLLQGEMSQPPARALTGICCDVAERSKKIVYLPFGTSNMKWLESKWKHGGADSLHQRLGANVDIEAGEGVFELEPGGSHLEDETAKLTTLDVDDL